MLPLPVEDTSTERLTVAFSPAVRALPADPRYVLRERLGRGGMGEVYLGTMVSPAGERLVAIKRLLAKGADKSEARRRLVAEARLVFQLTHGNISQVLDLGANERGTYVVMEYVHGLDLAALIRVLRGKHCALDIASAVYIAREVARALDYAHRRVDEAGRPLQLVHGDVTPQNILLSVEGEVKLTDFGIARALGTLAPGSRIRGGTPGYVAPELARQDPDHRADIYSLGMTLCAALTGRTPNESEIDPRGLRTERPDATAGLCSIIERATAPRPENRFLSAGDLERALALELARRCPGFTPSALAAIVAEHVRGQRVAQVEGHQTLTSITASEMHSAVELSGARPVPQSEPGRPLRTQTHVSTETEPRGWLRHVLLLVLALLIVAASAAVAVVRSMPAESPPSPRFAAPMPAAAAPVLPAPEPEGAKPTPPPPPVVTHALTRSSHARAAHAKADPGYVSVSSTPWGAVYIDGRRIAEETPVYRLPLSPGPHRVHIVYGDHGSSAVQRVIVHSGQTRTLGFDR